MVRAVPIVFVLLLMPAPMGLAQEVKRLEPVVVTATKIETPQERLGAAVTVITEEELKTHHYETVGDALRQVPGVEIQRSGSLGKLTSLRIRGAGATQVQVLVDGLRVKSPTSGDFNFSDLAIEQIERIEIVRGPQSTLYGADAIGGVVHIITKRGLGPPAAALHLQGGSFETHREQLSVGGSYKLLDYAFSASAFESGGQFRNDDSEQRGLTGRLGLALPWNGHISLSVRYARSDTDLPVDRTIRTRPFFILDPDAQQQNELTTLSLQWEQKPIPGYELRLRFGQFWNQLGFQDPLTPGIDFGSTISQINTRRREVELVNHFHLGRWNTLSVGLEHRNDRGTNRRVFREEIDVQSVFLQDELRLFDRLFLSGGVRVEDNEVFGTEATPRAGAVYLVKEWGTKLRGSYGEGFRAPTINDLFFPGFGNPDLRPEQSRSWDAGIEQKLWANRIRLGATYFRNTFEDLIQFLLVGGLFRPENVAKARTEGLEFNSEVDILDNLFFSVNYTFTDTENLITGLPLRRFAPHRWNLGVSWDPTRALNLFAQANVVSSQFEAASFQRNPGYHRIDVGGTYHLVEKKGSFPGLDFTLRVQNLTDERYFETFGFRALGVNVLAGFQVKY
ncbi:MAG: TonB-dependent receptor [Candidatus Rokubacteria bacterium]|nr:TonB-dependent receptor [Candidatus Rokubacteria bacterium]